MTSNQDKTLYVVGGFMRTGTSMMMKALEAGGMDAEYDERRDDFRREHADDFYDPNEGGLYELQRSDYQKPNFPKMYKGKLIKCLHQGPMEFPVMYDGVKIVFMRRKFDEIRRSYRAFFDAEIKEYRNASEFQNEMVRIIERIQNRKDFKDKGSIDVFWLPDVIENPEEKFFRLKKSGWPIDVEKAARVVNPDLYRHKSD